MFNPENVGIYKLLGGSRIRDMSSYFTESGRQSIDGSTLAWFVLALVVVIGAIVAICYWHSLEPRKYYSPEKLFKSLCRLHGLSRNDRELLLQVVVSAEITQPALIFTDPSILRSAKNAKDEKEAGAIDNLHEKLFT